MYMIIHFFIYLGFVLSLFAPWDQMQVLLSNLG